jgi:hypothetical protein
MGCSGATSAATTATSACKPHQHRDGRHENIFPANWKSGSANDDRHAVRASSRKLQITSELVSDIYFSFAAADAADVNSAFGQPFEDTKP